MKPATPNRGTPQALAVGGCQGGLILSDIIKTGFVIEVLKSRDDAECDIIIHSRVDDWVPLSVLNRLLRERKKQLSKGDAAWNELHWVQSLLKNKKGEK